MPRSRRAGSSPPAVEAVRPLPNGAVASVVVRYRSLSPGPWPGRREAASPRDCSAAGQPSGAASCLAVVESQLDLTLLIA